MTEEDKRLIWALMPEWVKGLGLAQGDSLRQALVYEDEGNMRVYRHLVKILGPPDWTAFPAKRRTEKGKEA